MCPTRSNRSAAQRGQREAGEITAGDETGHGRLETLDRHRKEIKVLKKPLASWTPLVAMISDPISARIDPLDPIGPLPCRGRSADLHRPSPSTLSGSACPSRRRRNIDRATDATNPVSQRGFAGIIVVPTTGREKNPGRRGCPF